jgi:hypothetical protein
MRTSENLFTLIKSLTKSEKRYFNLNFLQKSSNKNYSKLFIEIEKQTRHGGYDEKEIKKKFGNEKFVRQLTFTKNYLYNLIVKSLIGFYSAGNIEAEIYNLIIAAKIFFKKSLFDDYFLSLEKAKILAENSEKFGAFIEIIKLQMKLVRLKTRKKYKNRNLYKEEQGAIEKIQNITGYSKLLNAFYKITKIPDYARSKILYKEALKIFENKLLSSEKYALSVTAKDMYYLLLLYKNEQLEKKKELFNISRKRHELYSNNQIVFTGDAENKELNLSYLLLHYSIIAHEKDFFARKIQEFEKKYVLSNNKIHKEEAGYFFIMLKMYFNSENNNLKESAEAAEKIFFYLRSTETIQNKDELFSFYFIYAKLLYETKNYLKALDVLNIILKHEYKNVRYDILSYSYFLELFVHYELKNYQLMSSYIRALTRKLSKHKEKDLSEKIILKFFTELCAEKKMDEQFVLKKYYKKLQTIKKNRFEKIFFSELPADKWILEKISNNALDK